MCEIKSCSGSVNISVLLLIPYTGIETQARVCYIAGYIWSYIRGHPLSTYAKFSEKLVFGKVLRTYLIDDPLV